MRILQQLRRPEVLIALLALAASATSLGNGFVYDDMSIVYQNRIVHNLGASEQIWHTAYWPAGLLYRPLTIQLFALQWAAGGGSRLVFHAFSVLLMILVALLFWRLARRILPPDPALAASALFAVHPVHVESVANVVGQAELLAAGFALLAIERYLAWRREGGLHLGHRVALAMVTLAAIASKETGYAIPLLLVAAEFLLAGKGTGWRDKCRALAPTMLLQLGVAAAAVLIRIIVLGPTTGAGPSTAFEGLSTGARIAGMLSVVPEWVRLMLWPAHLQAEYGPPGIPMRDAFGPMHLLGLLLLILTALLFLATRRRAPMIPFGLAWFAITILPVSNLLTPSGVVLAERTLFLPSAGALLVVGGGLMLLLPRLEARGARAAQIAWALLAGMVLAGAIRSSGRQLAWKEQAGFFRKLEADAPRTYRAQLAASNFYSEKGQYPAAERAARRAFELYRGDPQVHEQLGQMLRRRGRCADALPVLADGVRRFPERTLVRSRLIECTLAVGDTAGALALAVEGVGLGRTEFESTIRRLDPREANSRSRAPP